MKMPERIYRNGCEYTHPLHIQFIKDMDAVGLPIELRRTYAGSMPAVRVTDRKQAVNASTWSVNYEFTPHDTLVYARHADPLLSDQQKYSWGRD